MDLNNLKIDAKKLPRVGLERSKTPPFLIKFARDNQLVGYAFSNRCKAGLEVAIGDMVNGKKKKT